MPPKNSSVKARPAKRTRTLKDDESGSESEVIQPVKQRKSEKHIATAEEERPVRSTKPMKEVSRSARDNQENMEKAQTATKSKNSEKMALMDEEYVRTKRAPRTPPALTNEQLTVALEELEAKYNHLKKLRMTDAESHLEDYRQKLEEATTSAEQYRTQTEQLLVSADRMQEKLRDGKEVLNAKVRTLEQQVQEYERKEKARAQEDKKRARTTDMESVLASPGVTPNMAAHARTIHMYEDITGIKITPRPTDSRSSPNIAVWDLEHTGNFGTLCFTLTYNHAEESIQYNPYLQKNKDAKLIKSLPEYLTDEITFNKNYESKFFWRLINYNHETQ
ncbi:hypothetical protein CPB97_005822 [Podila verticillata]|nr:hypothetical protein CPB97_005822 [Podila verticillata]